MVRTKVSFSPNCLRLTFLLECAFKFNEIATEDLKPEKQTDQTDISKYVEKKDEEGGYGMLRATLYSVLLVLSVVGGGFIGPSSQLLETESAWVVTGYSLLLRSIYCMPIIPFEAMFSKRKYKDRLRQLLTCKSLVFLTLAPAF